MISEIGIWRAFAPVDRETLWGGRRDFLPGSQEVTWRDGNPPTNAWLPGFITAHNTRFGRYPGECQEPAPGLNRQPLQLPPPHRTLFGDAVAALGKDIRT